MKKNRDIIPVFLYNCLKGHNQTLPFSSNSI